MKKNEIYDFLNSPLPMTLSPKSFTPKEVKSIIP